MISVSALSTKDRRFVHTFCYRIFAMNFICYEFYDRIFWYVIILDLYNCLWCWRRNKLLPFRNTKIYLWFLWNFFRDPFCYAFPFQVREVYFLIFFAIFTGIMKELLIVIGFCTCPFILPFARFISVPLPWKGVVVRWVSSFEKT